jgi:hypothetical protein
MNSLKFESLGVEVEGGPVALPHVQRHVLEITQINGDQSLKNAKYAT